MTYRNLQIVIKRCHPWVPHRSNVLHYSADCVLGYMANCVANRCHTPLTHAILSLFDAKVRSSSF